MTDPHNYSKENFLFFSDLMEIKLSHQEMEVNLKCDKFKFLQLQSLDVKVFLTMQNKHNQLGSARQSTESRRGKQRKMEGQYPRIDSNEFE